MQPYDEPFGEGVRASRSLRDVDAAAPSVAPEQGQVVMHLPESLWVHSSSVVPFMQGSHVQVV